MEVAVTWAVAALVAICNQDVVAATSWAAERAAVCNQRVLTATWEASALAPGRPPVAPPAPALRSLPQSVLDMYRALLR